MSEANTAASFEPNTTYSYWTDEPASWSLQATTELESVRVLPRFILLHGAVLEDDELVLRVKRILHIGGDESGSLVRYDDGDEIRKHSVTETPSQILALINGETIELDDE